MALVACGAMCMATIIRGSMRQFVNSLIEWLIARRWAWAVIQPSDWQNGWRMLHRATLSTFFLPAMVRQPSKWPSRCLSVLAAMRQSGAAQDAVHRFWRGLSRRYIGQRKREWYRTLSR